MVVYGSTGLMSMSIRLGCELDLSSTGDGSAGGVYLKRLSDGRMNLLFGAFFLFG